MTRRLFLLVLVLPGCSSTPANPDVKARVVRVGSADGMAVIQVEVANSSPTRLVTIDRIPHGQARDDLGNEYPLAGYELADIYGRPETVQAGRTVILPVRSSLPIHDRARELTVDLPGLVHETVRLEAGRYKSKDYPPDR
jgi:hypothetical protein